MTFAERDVALRFLNITNVTYAFLQLAATKHWRDQPTCHAAWSGHSLNQYCTSPLPSN